MQRVFRGVNSERYKVQPTHELKAKVEGEVDKMNKKKHKQKQKHNPIENQIRRIKRRPILLHQHEFTDTNTCGNHFAPAFSGTRYFLEFRLSLSCLENTITGIGVRSSGNA